MVGPKGGRLVRIRGYAPATPCWAELASSDPAAAVAFYGDLLGWQATTTEIGSTVFTLRDLAAAGLVPTMGADQPSAWFSYMSTEDALATAESVTAGGGTVLLAPTEIAARGRMAMFADPEGAVFGAWQAGSFRGAQVASEPGAVCWNDVATRDPAAAAVFYGKVFGWSDQPGEVSSGFDYFEWSINNRVVAGMVPMDDRFPAEVPAHWRVTFEVADCAAAVAQCTALGGQVAIGPIDVKVGNYAQLLDPFGAAFGVIDLIPELRLTP